MNKLAAVILMMASSALGQVFIAPASPPDPAKVRYIAVMAVQVVDPSRSYAMFCPTSPVNCNTVYTLEYHYIPFSSAEDAMTYLNSTKDVFVRPLTVKEVPVEAKEVVTTIKHPDTEEKSTHYALPEQKK